MNQIDTAPDELPRLGVMVLRTEEEEHGSSHPRP
jgi:hypothetical protein